jgi:hypothetical protein
MSHYLLTKLRVADNGSITDVAVRQLRPEREGLAAIGVGPEQVLASQMLMGWIDAGDSVYVGQRDDASGVFEIGDEVRADARHEGFESCNVDGARTKALAKLPRLS